MYDLTSDFRKMSEFNNSIGLLFECSWEVCNKIGGIYTVLSTKARMLKEEFGDNLVFIGPDVWDEENPSPAFIERRTMMKSASSRVTFPHGIKIRTGRWDIPGSPSVILVDFKGIYPVLNEIFGEMWKEYGVDSLHAYGDYSEGCAFAVASAMVMKAISEYLRVDGSKVVGHFNEWTTGMGLLWLKSHLPQAATLFTTHATSIGRSICGNGKPLYDYFSGYNGDQMARELNMESKHSLEKTAAHQADCFTAVSEVTARECHQLLDIRPAVVTPNGFEPKFVPKTARYNKLRQTGRQRILEIATALTGNQYSSDTFIIGTSGRNEFRNKGLDVFLDSMDRMGEKINGREILALVLVPAWVKEPSASLKMALETYSKGVQPDYLTHRLNNEGEDRICHRIGELEREGRLGRSDRAKVIYVPCYLDGGDGIVNISYYDLLPALDLTIFASYYEPWGYTPLESVAFGVPTITTDKAGFGQWVLENMKSSIVETGVEVVARNDRDYSQTVEKIASIGASYSRASEKEVSRARNSAMATSQKADWRFFIAHYDEAFRIALRNASERN